MIEILVLYIEQKKRKKEHVYVPKEWMTLIETAWKRKPFDVVGADQSIFHNYQEHLSPLFKSNCNELHIRDIHILEYSHHHINEVWGRDGRL